MSRKIKLSLIIFISIFLSSCSKNGTVKSISENELFTIPYGNFEEQISVTDLNTVGSVRYGIFMRDGFFYVVNGESQKIMEFNSYGDLLTLFYNEDSPIQRLISKSNRPDKSVHHEISYPFDYPGIIAVDSNKTIYAVCTIPKDSQEHSKDGSTLYSQTVLRFNRDASLVEFIGQEGPGGTPFPYINNIYTTNNNELVVVSTSSSGFIVYWFGTDGYLKYEIPIVNKNVPKLKELEDNCYYSIKNVVPDLYDYKLYVNIDYYTPYIDEGSKVQSGINYVASHLYPLDIESEVYEDSVSIPPYEESVVVDYSRLVYKIPYDFLGITKNGWKFFILKTESGFDIEMIQNESQRIIRRHLNADHSNILFDKISLSDNGIITVLYIEKDKARVVWYRTDNLIDAFLEK
ncbi:MAG: hypothetical protein K6D95_10445 [Treponema sp.]|nr:hypothetical protein [Treponema sp.]